MCLCGAVKSTSQFMQIDAHLLLYVFILICTSDTMINCKYNNQIINDLVLASRMLNLQRIDAHLLSYLFL